jgi:integrase
MPFTKSVAVNPSSRAFAKFLNALEGMDWDTKKDYRLKLAPFLDYCKSEYDKPVDDIIKEIKAGNLDQYEFLSDYKVHLLRSPRGSRWSPNNLRSHVKKARNFLESCGIEFSDRQFKSRVKLPRAITRRKVALKKETIRELIKQAPDQYMRTFMMLLAATGMRPVEALSIRHRDLDLDSNPGRVTIRPEFTKMRVERYTFLTSELTQQIKDLLAYKHRARKLACKEKVNYPDARTMTVKRKDKKNPNAYYYYDYYMVKLKPQVRPNDLLFAIYRRDETVRTPHVVSLYDRYARKLNSMLTTMGLDGKEEDGRRHKITEYSLRRFVKTTISNAGYHDFSEWHIGHKHSEYWNTDDEQKIAVFKEIESRLTFMDTKAVEAHSATVESKLQASDERIEQLQAQVSKLNQWMEKLGNVVGETDAIKSEVRSELIKEARRRGLKGGSHEYRELVEDPEISYEDEEDEDIDR